MSCASLMQTALFIPVRSMPLTATQTGKRIGGLPMRNCPGSLMHYHHTIPGKYPPHRLMQRLDLCFGAIDIIRRPDGEYVSLLEVNPQGEWGMLQKYLGYPIAETIAEKRGNL